MESQRSYEFVRKFIQFVKGWCENRFPMPETRPVVSLRIAGLFLACVSLWMWWDPPFPAKWQRLLENALEEGGAWRWQAHAALWLPRAAAVNAVMFAVIAALSPWFLKTPPAHQVKDMTTNSRRLPRWLVIAVIGGAMLGSGLLNAPRLGHSLWSDEEFSMSHFIVGEYEQKKDGSLSWLAVPWARTLWDHRTPNNHAVYSVLAKLAHIGHQSSPAPGDWTFSEARLRLPAFLAGLLALPVLYLLMRELGLPRAGLAVVVLLAAHPWLVRYSTEARGYALTFLLWPAAVLFLLKGLHTGKWRWWLGFALSETLLLWSWTGMVHWLLLLNAAALGLIFTSRNPAIRFQFRRWTAAGALATICYLPLGLPMLPQLQDWMATGRAKAPGIAPGWLADSLSWLLTGEPWRSQDPANVLCPGRFETLATDPVLTVIWFACAGLAAGWGLVIFWRHSRETRWLLGAMLLPLAMLASQAAVTGNLLMPWYACPLLPAAAMLLGAMAETTWNVRWAAPAAALLAFGLLTSGHRMRTLLRHHEMEPNRAATALTRGVVNPRHADYGKGVITAQFSCRRPGYDPGLREINSAADLTALQSEAVAGSHDLFVNIGDADAAAQRWPDILTKLSDRTQFYEPSILPGMDHAQTRVVWKARRNIRATQQDRH